MKRSMTLLITALMALSFTTLAVAEEKKEEKPAAEAKAPKKETKKGKDPKKKDEKKKVTEEKPAVKGKKEVSGC